MYFISFAELNNKACDLHISACEIFLLRILNNPIQFAAGDGSKSVSDFITSVPYYIVLTTIFLSIYEPPLQSVIKPGEHRSSQPRDALMWFQKSVAFLPLPLTPTIGCYLIHLMFQSSSAVPVSNRKLLAYLNHGFRQSHLWLVFSPSLS